MAKRSNKPYTKYANCVLRKYARIDINAECRNILGDNDKITMNDLCACHDILSTLSQKRREALLEVYRHRAPIAENIELVATRRNIPVRQLWELIHEVSKSLDGRRETTQHADS